MFTGIIDHKGKVIFTSDVESGQKMHIQTQFTDLTLGESISVNGTCLTVEAFSQGQFQVQLSSETLQTAAFDSIHEGSWVNLERALRVGDRMGGHWVTGHVDTVGLVAGENFQGEFRYLEIRGVSEHGMPHLIPKGSVAVQGVSLTVNEVFSDGFSVMLIPHTLEKTNLETLKVGAKVNLEFDIFVKTILQNFSRFLEAKK